MTWLYPLIVRPYLLHLLPHLLADHHEGGVAMSISAAASGVFPSSLLVARVATLGAGYGVRM
ncbi:hypothetical protein [Mycolicibacterium llatzerense]|uniref:hypothetical protein n=1 Tax=Mycolicibacterium llatzerense TaxID=280871 RepID=UPI0021B585FE|nr:hypothetical protein [Mycolicibacterium llatzerense]